MGACFSCLGLRHAHEPSEPSESSRLLNDDPYQQRYGVTPQRPVSSPPQPDPEQLRREREALERICASASNKLIDVTHTGRGEQPAPSTEMHYARLFRESFATYDSQSTAVTIAGYPFTPSHGADSPSRDTQGSTADEREADRQRAAASARAWLRDAIEDVSTGKKWDPTSVKKIAGKLTFSFDDLDVEAPQVERAEAGAF